MIYLDSASSFPLLPQVRQALIQHWEEYQGYGENPSARHPIGKKLHELLGLWEQELCQRLQIAPKEWVWTSGATESNNLAIHLAQSFFQRPIKAYTHPFVHASMVEPVHQAGIECHTLPLNDDGLVDCAQAAEMIAPHVAESLILWPYGDNEWGLCDLPQAALKEWHQAGAWIHIDAAQSFAKIPFEIRTLPCQSLTVSGHKFGALSGIGGLFLRLRPRKPNLSLISGGGQQNARRSGTLPMSLILSFMIAWQQWHSGTLTERTSNLRHLLAEKIAQSQGYVLYDQEKALLPHMLLIQAEDKSIDFSPQGWLWDHIAFSQGSACQSLHEHGSAALAARGYQGASQKSFVRLSTHPLLKESEIEQAATLLNQALTEKKS